MLQPTERTGLTLPFELPLERKVLAVLKALLDGRGVKIGTTEYFLLENNDIGIKGIGGTTHGESFVYLGTGISFSGFINMIDKMSDADVLVLFSNSVLKEHHNGKKS